MNCQLPESVALCCELPEVPPPHAERMTVIMIVAENSRANGTFADCQQNRGSSRFVRHGVKYLVNLCMMPHVLQSTNV